MTGGGEEDRDDDDDNHRVRRWRREDATSTSMLTGGGDDDDDDLPDGTPNALELCALFVPGGGGVRRRQYHPYHVASIELTGSNAFDWVNCRRTTEE